MENWTEEQLREAVDKKHGKEKNKVLYKKILKKKSQKKVSKFYVQATTTDKICHLFIKAVETKKYGWFWECPKGLKCIYRHVLPEGTFLKFFSIFKNFRFCSGIGKEGIEGG